MKEILLINPAGYSGQPRRGPYELAQLKADILSLGYECNLIDIQYEVGKGNLRYPKHHLEDIRQFIINQKISPDLALITFRTTAGPWALMISKLIKELYPKCILGAFAPRIEKRIEKALFHEISIDLLFKQREINLLTIDIINELNCHETANVFSSPNYVRAKTTIKAKLNPPKNKKTHSLPLPWISHDKSIAGIQVGKGCPENCTFCAANINEGSLPTYQDAKSIVELAQASYDKLNPKSARFVMFETENLTSNKLLINQIVTLRKNMGYSFKWGCYGRVDHIDNDFLNIITEGGCCFIFFGLESGSERIQRIIGKRLNLKKAIPTIKSLHKNKILTQSSFMFGLPEETYDDLILTAEMAAEVSWAGGIIDWTSFRLESETVLEKNLGATPKVLLSNSELYKDIADAGISPNSINPEIGYRMYGLSCVKYDLNTACIAVEHWRKILLETPLTLYSISHGTPINVKEIFDYIFLNPNQSSDSHQILEEFINLIYGQSKQFIQDFFCFETRNCETKIYDFNGSYDLLRQDPTLIPQCYKLSWWGLNN